MVIFLHGPDGYRRQQKQDFYIREFSKKHSSSGIAQFDLAEARGLENLSSFLKNQSMFDPVRLAVLEGAFEIDTKTLAEILSPLLKSERTHVLVSEEGKPPKPLAFLTKKSSVVKDFPSLSGAEWKKFVTECAEENGVTLSPAALLLLAEAYEGDSWRLVTEFMKMRDLPGSTVGEKELGSLEIEVAPEFFGLLQGVRAPRVERRLSSLSELLLRQEPGAKIFNILSSFWTEKSDDLAKIDIAVKSGKTEYEEGLLSLVLG